VFGTVAGLLELFIGLLVLFFGDYISFAARLKIMKVLYKVDKLPDFTDPNGFLDFENISLPWTYVKNYSSVSFCCFCCRSD
jgi:hypothetical protein